MIRNDVETEVILIRHGETRWNREGRWQGHADSPLTESGLVQAKALARRLSSMDFSALYSSDLGRAQDTASIIARETGHEILFDSRLRERNVGIFQGLTLLEMKDQFPDVFQRYLNHDSEYVIPEGESMNQRFAINIQCVNELAEKHRGQSVVVVTHGGVLNSMFRYVLKLPPEANRRYKIKNTSINSFVHGENGWVLQTWGDVSHVNG
jgi:probable phosphoglycerate mutase